MKHLGRVRAFTLSEMLVSIGASVIVIGGLLTGSIGLQRALFENETRIAQYADQRRIVDYVARDLRRATSIVATDGEHPLPVSGGCITLEGATEIKLTLPGYYASEEPKTEAFDDPLPLQHYETGATYGTAAAPAADVVVTYRKLTTEKGEVKYVREEAGSQEVIVRAAEPLTLRLFISDDGRTCDLEAIYRTYHRGYRQVSSTFDQAMLRNPPEGLF